MLANGQAQQAGFNTGPRRRKVAQKIYRRFGASLVGKGEMAR